MVSQTSNKLIIFDINESFVEAKRLEKYDIE